jgi:hypothetical protein
MKHETKLTKVTKGTYETRTTKIIVGVKGEQIFSDSITEVEIIDEAAGEFLEISQDNVKLRFDKDEWPHIRSAVNKMFKLCRNYD